MRDGWSIEVLFARYMSAPTYSRLRLGLTTSRSARIAIFIGYPTNLGNCHSLDYRGPRRHQSWPPGISRFGAPEHAKFLSGERLTVSSEVTCLAAEQKVMEPRRQAIYALVAFYAASFLTTPRAQPTFD